MSIGIECLLADDPAKALELAERLDRLNSERRVIEARMQQEALALVARLRFDEPGVERPAALSLYDPDWHPGIVGLIAARVREQVHRPVVAFAPAEGGLARGSARSVPGVHIRDALEAVATRRPGLIERFGGHAMAAGLTLPVARLAEFGAELAAEVARRAEPALLRGVLLTDGELASGEITLQTALELRAGGPWGAGFPEPSFDGEFSVAEVRVLGGRHLKLWVRPDERSAPSEAIAFGWLAHKGGFVPGAGARLRLVYRLDVNEYQGLTRAQLLLDHLEPA